MLHCRYEVTSRCKLATTGVWARSEVPILSSDGWHICIEWLIILHIQRVSRDGHTTRTQALWACTVIGHLQSTPMLLSSCPKHKTFAWASTAVRSIALWVHSRFWAFTLPRNVRKKHVKKKTHHFYIEVSFSFLHFYVKMKMISTFT